MADSDPPIRPAATVLLVRDGEAGLEVLMQRRNPTMVFASGNYVFPGGRVDDADGEGEAAYVAAAVRECREEAGLTVDAGDLVWMAHWVTPRGEPRRFDTRFFLAVAPEGQDALHDGEEAVATEWVRPDDGLAHWKAKEWTMMPPTVVCLRNLSEHATAAAAMAWARGVGTPVCVRPRERLDADGKRIGLALPWDADYDDWRD
jgi:8-oxo-dGTP pyrophosphatase MutT (NUDIX family)